MDIIDWGVYIFIGVIVVGIAFKVIITMKEKLFKRWKMVYINYLGGFKKIPPKSDRNYVKLSSVGEKQKNKCKYLNEDEVKQNGIWR